MVDENEGVTPAEDSAGYAEAPIPDAGIDAPEPAVPEAPAMPEPEVVTQPVATGQDFEPPPPPAPEGMAPQPTHAPPPPPPPAPAAPEPVYAPPPPPAPPAPPAPPSPPYGATQMPSAAAPVPAQGVKSKVVAGVLGILLGGLGIHKFYLGYTKEGLIMLLVSIIGGVLTGGIAASVMGIIGLVEGIMYLIKSDQEFYDTYIVNSKPWF